LIYVTDGFDSRLYPGAHFSKLVFPLDFLLSYPLTNQSTDQQTVKQVPNMFDWWIKGRLDW